MLITFRSKAYNDITMFGDVAVGLIKLMGHSGSVPGALAAADVPAALARLRAAIEVDRAHKSPVPADDGGDESHERVVSLAHRALPLLEMLAAAVAADSHVMWDA